MGKPGLTYIKQILSEKFDSKQFVSSHLTEFFKQFALYLVTAHKEEKKKKSSSKKINGENIVKALEKLLPQLNQTDIKLSACPDLDTIFSYLLHPETPANVREPCAKLFRGLLQTISDDGAFERMKNSITLLIPFALLARNDNEKQSLMKCVPSSIRALNSGGDPIDTEAALRELHATLDFVADQWKRQQLKFCSSFIFDNIFAMVYPKPIQSTGYPLTTPGGFDTPSPAKVHNEIISLFGILDKFGGNLMSFIETKQKAKVLFAIFSDGFGENANETASPTFLAMNHFIKKPYFNVLNEDEVIINMYKLCVEILSKCSPDSIPKISSSCELFLSNLIQMLYNDANHTKFSDCLAFLYRYILNGCNDNIAITIQQSILLFALNNREVDSSAWDTIVENVKQSDILAITTCRFSHFIATIAAPRLYSIDVPKTIEFCTEVRFRTKRNHTTNTFDFLCEHFETIWNEPSKFVTDQFELGFEPLVLLIPKIQNFPFPNSIGDIPTETRKMQELISYFITPFSNFYTSKNISEQNNMFSIIYTFFFTFLKMSHFPPGVTYNRCASFINSGQVLSYACLHQDTPDTIKIAAFKILSESINTSALKNVIAANALSHWYMILYFCVLSTNKALSEEAFAQACITLRIGFVGSTILVPLLLEAIENKLISCENINAIGFLSSAPLFDHAPVVPDAFLNEVYQIAQSYPKSYSNMVKEMTFTGKVDMKMRVMICLKRIKDGTHAVTAASAFIANEIVQQKPNAEVLGTLVNLFKEPIAENHLIEALNGLMGIMIYFTSLIQYCPNEVKELLTLLTAEATKLTFEDKPEWIFTLITTLTSLFIHTYSVVSTSDDVTVFCKFLAEFSSRAKAPESFSKSLTSLALHSLDLMSVYFGNYPFPHSPLYPSNTSITPDKENFIDLNHRTLVHAVQREKVEQIDFINEVGKFSWTFQPVCADFLQEEKVNPIDIPTNAESVKAAELEKGYLAGFSQPINNVLKSFEEENGKTMPFDFIDDEDSDVFNTSHKIEEKFNQLKKGNKSQMHIRPSLEVSRSAGSPLMALNILSFNNCNCYDSNNNKKGSENEIVKRIESNKNSNILFDKIECHGHRIRMKIAVVYVGKGKDDQNQILSTKFEETSPHFREFLMGLGWPVDLSAHSAHTGGLDLRGGRSGSTSIYYADFNNEVMYHVAPLLPTVANDEQQVLKKRHIGNDHIHIVFCDNDHEFDPTTITSQFGMVQIVVYPLVNSLFRVEIYWRNDVPWFGPLRQGVIVQKKALPSLVRSTALDAMMNLWYQQKAFYHPLTEMSEILDELIEKHVINDKVDYVAIQEYLGHHPSP